MDLRLQDCVSQTLHGAYGVGGRLEVWKRQRATLIWLDSGREQHSPSGRGASGVEGSRREDSGEQESAGEALSLPPCAQLVKRVRSVGCLPLGVAAGFHCGRTCTDSTGCRPAQGSPLAAAASFQPRTREKQAFADLFGLRGK